MPQNSTLDQLNHHQQYLVQEFAEDYLENKIERRAMLKKVMLITGSVPLTASVLFSLGCSGGGSDTQPSNSNSSAAAPTTAPSPTVVPTPVGPGVPENDPAITALAVEYPGTGGPVKAYLARPKDRTGVPAVVLVHENRGLTDHFKDVARRYAKEGFVALAVDLLSRAGGTSATDANANTAALGVVSRNPADLTADLVSSVAYLKAQPFVKATAIGASGWCFGGGYTWEVTAASPDIKAAVPYYGTVTPTVMDNMSKIAGPVLMIYAGNDTRINAQMEETKAKMAAVNKPFEQKVYPNVNHAFFNDTGQAYNKEAADDAWKVTLAHFRKHLV